MKRTFYIQRFENKMKCYVLRVFSVDEKRERTLTNILSAKNKIRYEISELNERLKQSKELIQQFKDDITKRDDHEEKPVIKMEVTT